MNFRVARSRNGACGKLHASEEFPEKRMITWVSCPVVFLRMNCMEEKLICGK
jgi:hypothetical protein